MGLLKRRRPGLGFVLAGACLAGVTRGYTGSVSSKPQKNVLARQTENHRLSPEDDRSCASKCSLQKTTTGSLPSPSTNKKNRVNLPPWISRHETVDKAFVEKKVEWLEFHMLEIGFSPLDIRDVAVTMEKSSNGDTTLLAGIVEFLQLLLQLEEGQQITTNKHVFVTKQVLMASAIHYAECTSALHTGVYDIVREAIYRDGNESGCSNLSWLLSDTANQIIDDDPVTEYIETELTKATSSIVLIEHAPRTTTRSSSSSNSHCDENDDVARIVLGAARVKRAEITARAVLGNGRVWSKDEASRLRGLLLTVMGDWRSLGIRAVACLYRLDGILNEQGELGQYNRTPEVVRAAKEAIRVYAPLAQRLGMQRLKARIEDGAFRVLYRRQYRAASALYRQSGPAMKTMSRYLEGQIANLLLGNDQLMSQIADIQITSRVKEPYSAWKKLVKKRFVASSLAEASQEEAGALTMVKKQQTPSHLSFVDIKDSVALRVIIQARKGHNELDEVTRAREQLLCYYVQHLIRTQWPLLKTDRVKDYIQHPKENGYQSLHYNSCITSQGQEWPFEVQVRSEEMHRVAEFGVAAHWDYKLGSKYVTTTAQLPPTTAQHKQLVKVHQLEGARVTNGSEDVEVALPVFLPPAEDSYIDALVTAKDQLLQNKAFVFFASSTAAIENDGQILSLPVGATIGQALEGVQEATIASKLEPTEGSQDVKILRNGRVASVEDLVGNGDVLLINWTAKSNDCCTVKNVA